MKAVTNAPLYAAFYARIAEVCRGMGYALLVHGTLQNDLDVLAMPWVEVPAPPEELVTAVASSVEGAMPRGAKGDGTLVDMRDPVKRLHGRYVWTIVLRGGLFIDFGVVAPSWWIPAPAINVPRHIDADC